MPAPPVSAAPLRDPAVIVKTRVAEQISDEPGERFVILEDLGKLRPPAALSATVTYGALLADDGSADDVAAMPVMLEANAFATVPLRADANADLIEPAGLRPGRDEPLAGTLVAAEHRAAVKLEQAVAAEHVPWLWFGGGALLWLR